MTSEQKALAWEYAAKLIRDECDELSRRGPLPDHVEHARVSVYLSLIFQANRIRSTQKWKRENHG